MIWIYNYGEFLFSTKQALKEQCVWTRALASAGDWDTSACEQQGSCPYFHTFGTSLSTACYFGWASLRLEMITAFQVHNGPISSDAKSDICQSDTAARRGTQARWVIMTGRIRFLGICEVLSLSGCGQTTSVCGCRCNIAMTKEFLTYGGPYWQTSAQAHLELCASRDPLCVCTRKWEPRWRLSAGLQGPGV